MIQQGQPARKQRHIIQSVPEQLPEKQIFGNGRDPSRPGNRDI